MARQNQQCAHCARPTNIRRGYGVALLVLLIILVGPFALIYYFYCGPQCQTCKGTDIVRLDTRRQHGGGSGGNGTPPSTGAPI